ncbi:stearoyl-CoA 9-desaturase [Stygiomarasmius scandens]|uniref:Stearoyl-CoA 9-desaturase n=1 Tax=Marasmiellus scandens TaxID=2682957 RepID=A0ABR1JZH9_9AGAR
MPATKKPDSSSEVVPIDLNIPDNYVSYTLKNAKPLPPVTLSNLLHEINWISFSVITLTPLLGILGAYHVKLRWETALWSVIYYFCTGLGITAGYHRLWSHRSYNASVPLRVILALFGAGAVQGSIKWWSRGHRAHHRYTDTPLDPYNAHEGFWWAHVGWMLVKPRIRPGVADVSDLRKDKVVRWQHRNYLVLLPTMAFIVPMVVAWVGWGDALGGLVYAGVLRLVFVHHSTFCVNSLAHWLGETPFDDKHTPRDHMITAFVTVGEGYHNFHHQFPMDYRNAIKWYQYDPTKWFIWVASLFGLASHLKVFPSNEINKGVLTMQLKRLRETQEGIEWPSESRDLPVVGWDDFQEQAKSRPLVLISGFIHDVSDFMEEHPGGKHLLVKFIGKDATTAFFGGVYDHSNAAHNLLAMKRVGILHGGHPHASDIKIPSTSLDEKKLVPPSQRLKIAKYSELRPETREVYPNRVKPTYDMSTGGDYGSTTAVESDHDEEEDYKKL